MGSVRRLDHVGVAVRNTDQALGYFRDVLGLRVAHVEVNDVAGVHMTYLDAGNAYIQLLEPRRNDAPIAVHLRERGEGIHHICLAVDDVETAVRQLLRPGATIGAQPPIGSGRGRPAAFVPGAAINGVRIECTAFDLRHDIETRTGWLTD